MFAAREIGFRWKTSGPVVLKRVSFEVGPGEVLGIRGPSGTGKTTLARILGGYLAPNTGRVLLDGAEIPNRGAAPVQVIFQHAETAINPRWKIGRILTEGWQPDAATLDRFGVRPDWHDRYPYELSGGELQRIAIVRALMPGLRVLVADELTAMHDTIAQARLWRALLATVRDRRIAVIAISHDAPLLAALDARTMELRGGHLVPAPPVAVETAAP